MTRKVTSPSYSKLEVFSKTMIIMPLLTFEEMKGCYL